MSFFWSHQKYIQQPIPFFWFYSQQSSTKTPHRVPLQHKYVSMFRRRRQSTKLKRKSKIPFMYVCKYYDLASMLEEIYLIKGVLDLSGQNMKNIYPNMILILLLYCFWQKLNQMVDRYESLLENSSMLPTKHKSSSFQLRQDIPSISATNKSPQIMKKCIRQYKLAATPQEQKQIAEDFQEEQRKLKQNREELARHFKTLQKQPETAEFLSVKEELLKVVKVEMSLDVEMKEIVNKRKEEKQMQVKQFPQASTKLKNALHDIEQKRDQLLYLEQSVDECLQLLELIGILVFENGKKIDEALVNVELANRNIGKALDKIEVAKMRSKRSTNRKCCIIILGLIAIAIALVVVFGVIKF